MIGPAVHRPENLRAAARWPIVMVGVLLALTGACSDDGATGDTSPELPAAPAACAGPARTGLEEVHRYSWASAQAQLEADAGSKVWLGFSRVLSVDEVGELLQPLTVHMVQLVYEEAQGTYLKAQIAVPDVRADDPAFGQAARGLLEHAAGRPPVSLPGIEAGATDPVDPAVVAGEPPIAGLMVSGDVAGVITVEPCLIHSMAPGDIATPAPISPAIEPDPVHIDAG